MITMLINQPIPPASVKIAYVNKHTGKRVMPLIKKCAKGFLKLVSLFSIFRCLNTKNPAII